MKVMRKHVDSGELRIGDFEPLWIFLFVEFSTYGQARLGSGSGNEFDDCAKAAQGFAAPVDADEREKPVLELKFPIRVCHLPPGTSKWNKIEHRLFSFININRRGKPLRTFRTNFELIAHTTPQ